MRAISSTLSFGYIIEHLYSLSSTRRTWCWLRHTEFCHNHLSYFEISSYRCAVYSCFSMAIFHDDVSVVSQKQLGHFPIWQSSGHVKRVRVFCVTDVWTEIYRMSDQPYVTIFLKSSEVSKSSYFKDSYFFDFGGIEHGSFLFSPHHQNFWK